jgi:hypothetical protein
MMSKKSKAFYSMTVQSYTKKQLFRPDEVNHVGFKHRRDEPSAGEIPQSKTQ